MKTVRILSLILLMSCFAALSFNKAQASEEGFKIWASKTLSQMVSANEISEATMTKVLNGITYKPKVIELDKKQPEKKISFATYRKRILSKTRIDKGRAMYKKHSALLEEIGKKYGVQPKYIIALWGIETNYGGFTGGMQVLSSLATLAYDGRRAEFFTSEFKKAIKISEKLNKPISSMKGSWAGAMGQCQFMPSSYLAYAVDYDGDGKKDIWSSMPDVFASMANYLSSVGWDGDLKWGRKVTLPQGFSMDLEGRKIKKPISFWSDQNIRLASGGSLPKASDIKASIIVPDKDGADAYMVYKNYNTIMHWNRSTYFATSVGLLADQIAMQ